MNWDDGRVVLAVARAGRFVARKLTDRSIGRHASAGYLLRHPAPARPEDLAGRALAAYVEELNSSPALDHSRSPSGGTT